MYAANKKGAWETAPLERDSAMNALPDKSNCTGCSACAAACPVDAIRMEPDEFGFFHPAISDAACVSCGKCATVCPINTQTKQRIDTQYFAARCKSPEALMQSTSGGVSGVLAAWVIEQGGVVYGAAYNEVFQVHHVRITESENLARLQGTKYAQSNLGQTFQMAQQDLTQGKTVLFSGTPCQIMGLTNFLGPGNERLITVDLVCHSVPAPKAWEKYLEYRRTLDEKTEPPIAIEQRSKKTGWVNYSYCSAFFYPDGKESLVPAGADVYMKAFIEGMITNSACASCPAKGTVRCSDITLGDFWGIEKLGLELQTQDGVSAVMVHSEKGKNLWYTLSDKLISIPVTKEQMLAQNPAIENCAVPSQNREDTLKRIIQEGFGPMQMQRQNKRAKSQLWTRIQGKISAMDTRIQKVIRK